MQAAKVRVVVAAVLFLGWLGWLGYLVIVSRDMVVLSRPQFLVADLWIIADIQSKDGRPFEPTLREIVWPARPDPAPGQGPIDISNLHQVRSEDGWAGAGAYIIPLTRTKTAAGVAYQVTAVPASPGYDPPQSIQIVAVGNDKAAVVRRAASISGQDPANAEQALGQLPWELRRKVPHKEAVKIKDELESAGARVKLSSEEDLRIYPATSQDVEELTELRARKD